MAVTLATETERKYDVDESTPIPDLSGVGEVRTVEAVTLDATYFDTTDGALAARLITLRRRTGGGDEGWHLKTPGVAVRGIERTEYQTPLADELPTQLLDRVRAVIRDRALVEVARLSTRRSVTNLRGGDGEPVAEVADDLVSAMEVRSGTLRRWREWEVELLDAAPRDPQQRARLLDAIEEKLVRAGAAPSPSASKLARAMCRSELGADRATASLSKSSTSIEVVAFALGDLVDALIAVDPLARADEADAIHAMRIVVRRIRSLLASFRTVLDREVTDCIRARLRVLGAILGEARDAEVRRMRALELLDAAGLPATAAIDLRRRLVNSAEAEYDVGHDRVIEYLNGAEYFRLLDDLDELIARPPPTGASMTEAGFELRAALRRESRHGRKLLKGVNSDDPESLHEARKAARRLRFAAEALSEGAGAILGKKSRALAAAAKEVQDAIGDYRDASLFVDRLKAASREAMNVGDDAAAYAALIELECGNAREALSRVGAAAYRLTSFSGK